MGRRRREEEDDEDEDGGEEPREQKVPRELTRKEVEERRLELANKTVELFDLEDKRTKTTKRTNDKIKDLKDECRELANQVRTGVQMVPAQMTLDEAKKSRRRTERSVQDNGAAVEP